MFRKKKFCHADLVISLPRLPAVFSRWNCFWWYALICLFIRIRLLSTNEQKVHILTGLSLALCLTVPRASSHSSDRANSTMESTNGLSSADRLLYEAGNMCRSLSTRSCRTRVGGDFGKITLAPARLRCASAGGFGATRFDSSSSYKKENNSITFNISNKVINYVSSWNKNEIA